MSPKRTTAPPARKRSRSSSSGQERLIAKEKIKKQSAKTRLALDNRFHRTDQTLTCAAKAHVATAARRTACLHVSRAMQAARRREILILTSRLGRRAEAGPRRVLPRVRPPDVFFQPSHTDTHGVKHCFPHDGGRLQTMGCCGFRRPHKTDTRASQRLLGRIGCWLRLPRSLEECFV